MRTYKISMAWVLFLFMSLIVFPIEGSEEEENPLREAGEGPGKAQEVVLTHEKRLIEQSVEALVAQRTEEQRRHLEGLLAELKEANAEEIRALKEKNSQEIQALKAQLSAVLKQKPPTFRQQVTTNKYIWGLTALTGVSFLTSLINSYNGFWSLPYSVIESCVENLPLIINLYYVGKILADSGTIVGSVSSQVARE